MSSYAANQIPFPEALNGASVEVQTMTAIVEEGLLTGNGDLNGIAYSQNGSLRIQLSKNDVWDARLLTQRDNPLPSLRLLKKMVTEDGWPAADLETQWWRQWIIGDRPNTGHDSYNQYPFPCPVSCGQVRVGPDAVKNEWRNIREQGSAMAQWQTEGARTVMRLKGTPGASVGYARNISPVPAGEYGQLRMRSSGSANARFFVQLFGADNRSLFSSGWIDASAESVERVLKLPAAGAVEEIWLYAMSVDGMSAEIAYETICFENVSGGKEPIAVDLSAPALPDGFVPLKGEIDLKEAALSISGGMLESPVRMLTASGRNMMLIYGEEECALIPGGQAFLPKADTGNEGDVQWMVQSIPGDADWPGMSYAVALLSSDADGLTAVSVVTSQEASDPRADAIRTVRDFFRNREESRVLEEHDAEWTRFWSRSGIRTEHRNFQDLWYRQLYVLRCIARPGRQCPGLFAGLTSDTPMWHGDYHLNYNLQQTFWSALSSNHPELLEPYNRLILEYLPRAEWLAETVYETQGAFYPHILYAYESDPRISVSHNRRQYMHHVWGMTLGLGAFAVQPMWQQYKYWPDEERLRNEIWPVMRSVTLFYLDFMEKCGRDSDGKVRLGPTASPEIHPWTRGFRKNFNCAFDISQITYLLEAAVEAAAVLKTEPELVTRCRKALSIMPEYPVDAEQAVVVDVENSPVGQIQNIPGPYTPVFPGDCISYWSSEQKKELFMRTLLSTQTNGENDLVMGSVARSRLDVPDAFNWLETEVNKRRYPNGTLAFIPKDSPKSYNKAGIYSESVGVNMAVNELLLQSVDDIIRLFPGWSDDFDAEFRSLRVQGGFLVSASVEQGTVVSFEVLSTVGGQLKILNPWPARTVSVNGKSRIAHPDENGVVVFDTKPGQRLVFSAGSAVSRAEVSAQCETY